MQKLSWTVKTCHGWLTPSTTRWRASPQKIPCDSYVNRVTAAKTVEVDNILQENTCGARQNENARTKPNRQTNRKKRDLIGLSNR